MGPQPTKSRVEVSPDTPPTSPPPTPTTDASTPKPLLQTPTLKSASPRLYSTRSLPNRTGAQTSHIKGSRPAKVRTGKD
jgi:hypothetical protein